MTEIEPYQGRELAPTDSWVNVLGDVADLASKISGTEFVPKSFQGKTGAVAAAILYGREVGLPPMTTLKNTSVISGKPDLSAEAKRALVLAAGHEIEFVESTKTRCVMKGRRKGSETWTTAAYTLDEAKQSGDYNKNPNYKSRPEAMLIARASSRLCSMIFPDVTGGFAADVDISADVVDVPGEPSKATVTVERKPVQRRKAAPKRAAEPVAEVESGPISEPPLPGEDGFEALGSDETAPVDTETGEILDAELVETEPETAPEPPENGPEDGETSADQGEIDGDSEPGITLAQRKKLYATLNELNLAEKDEALPRIAEILGVEQIESTKSLTKAQASHVIDTLSKKAGQA